MEFWSQDLDSLEAYFNKHARNYGSSSNEYSNEQDVLIVLNQNGLALKHASINFKSNKKIVRVAVAQKGFALQFASTILK